MKRRESFARIVIVLVAFAWTVFGCNSQDSGSGSVPGSCTPVTSSAMALSISPQARSSIPSVVSQFADTGKVPDEQFINVTIALQINNEAELDSRIAQMYDPRSANFHKFISPTEFHSRYAPSQDQVDQAKSFLESHGIASVAVNDNGYLIQAVGQAAQLSEAFQTELHQYRDSDYNQYYAPAWEPKMPEGSPIRAVHGLHNVAHRRPFVQKANAGESPNYGSGPMGGLAPSDIREAYNLPSGVNGSGQTLALVELDGYSPSDIAEYEAVFGLPNVPLQNVLIDGYNGAAGENADEVTMDIELMVSIAPGASRIMVYEAPNTDQSILDIYSRIANDNAAAQVSTSWGSPEAENTTNFLETENVIFKQMAAQGQSFFAATGDLGAYANDSTLSVSDPAAQPFAVAVGGTHLNTSGGAYAGEYVWNNGSPTAGAGGGGVSIVWNQPTWQSGVANSRNGGSGSMRNLPDVSLNADPMSGYSIFLRGSWGVYAGTSAAAPLWAGFTALVNQARASRGLANLGFPNPSLYSIGNSSRYTNDFHDVVQGTNLYYPAEQGFDDATGWGSFNGQNLFEDLSTEPATSLEQLSC